MWKEGTLYQRWHEANERAREKENQLSRAWNDFFDRRTRTLPEDELIADVQRLRRAADELLKAMIDAGKR